MERLQGLPLPAPEGTRRHLDVDGSRCTCWPTAAGLVRAQWRDIVLLRNWA
jgi:hypothetical protein